MTLTRQQLVYLSALLEHRQAKTITAKHGRREAAALAERWLMFTRENETSRLAQAHEDALTADEHAEEGWTGLEELQETLAEAVALGDRYVWDCASKQKGIQQ